MPITREARTHFWTHVDVKGPDECWNWLGSQRDEVGEVELYFAGNAYPLPFLTYRAAYGLTYRPMAQSGQWLRGRIRILCRNRRCCNPAHIECQE